MPFIEIFIKGILVAFSLAALYVHDFGLSDAWKKNIWKYVDFMGGNVAPFPY